MSKAAKATSLLMVRRPGSNGNPVISFATAFWVGKTKLLTAAHCVLKSTECYIFSPGTLLHDLTTLDGQIGMRTPCKIIDYVWKSDYSEDIALLSVSGVDVRQWLPLVASDIPDGAVVGIVGYPGVAMESWFERKYPDVETEEHQKGAQLLPAGKLTVSGGQVVATRETIVTKISTRPGFSGSCLIYDGHVSGTRL